jgi:arsenate reductase
MKQAGVRPDIVLYQEQPPTARRILELAAMLGMPVARFVRTGDAAFKEATDLPGLDDEAALAAWVAAHPSTLERPIVVDERRRHAVIGRPPENVKALLPE